jgi:hypothetical protein
MSQENVPMSHADWNIIGHVLHYRTCCMSAGTSRALWQECKKSTISFVVSVRPHGTTRLPPDEVS